MNFWNINFLTKGEREMKLQRINYPNNFSMNGYLYHKIGKNLFLVVKDNNITRIIVRMRNKFLGII